MAWHQKRRQAIIRTNVDPFHWCMYAALGGDELTVFLLACFGALPGVILLPTFCITGFLWLRDHVHIMWVMMSSDKPALILNSLKGSVYNTGPPLWSSFRPGVHFRIWWDDLSWDFAKSQSHKMCIYHCPITLQFHIMILNSTAAKVIVKFKVM